MSSECKGECMTIVVPDQNTTTVQPNASAAAGKAAGSGDASGLWALTGIPVIGGAAAILSGGDGGSGGSGELAPPPSVPLGDSSLIPSCLIVLGMIAFMRRRLRKA